MKHERLKRVTKSNPCPICAKTDWCLVAPDGSAAICQRVEEGSKKRCGEAGWLHILSNKPFVRNNQRRQRVRNVTTKTSTTNWKLYAQQFSKMLPPKGLIAVARSLGVSAESLQRLGVGFDLFACAYTFPMSNVNMDIIGIRKRMYKGSKSSYEGCNSGLFIPKDLHGKGVLLVCEGPTDTAAGLDLGYDTIGRPDCMSCVEMTAGVCRGRDVTIVADNDIPKEDGLNPGKKGAELLARKLVLVCSSVRIIFPPIECKDLRGWYRTGITTSEIQRIIENTQPLTLEIKR